MARPCNILAGSAHSSDEGCFLSRDLECHVPLRLTFSLDSQKGAFVSQEPHCRPFIRRALIRCSAEPRRNPGEPRVCSALLPWRRQWRWFMHPWGKTLASQRLYHHCTQRGGLSSDSRAPAWCKATTRGGLSAAWFHPSDAIPQRPESPVVPAVGAATQTTEAASWPICCPPLAGARTRNR